NGQNFNGSCAAPVTPGPRFGVLTSHVAGAAARRTDRRADPPGRPARTPGPSELTGRPVEEIVFNETYGTPMRRGAPMALPLLPTSLVGSYAQPDWLIDRAKLAGRFPPRVRARELWRVAPEHLAQA